MNSSLVVALFVFVLFLVIWRRKEPFAGYWLADGDEFCQQAGLDSISLIIMEPTGIISKTSDAYLVIPDVFDGPCTISYWSGDKHGEIPVRISGVEIWPSDLIFHREPGGILNIKDREGHLYARMYKNTELGHLGKAARENT